jgi:hypothetical protein
LQNHLEISIKLSSNLINYDNSEEEDESEESEIEIKKIVKKKEVKIVPKKIIRKVIVNVACTEYEIVKKCAKNILNSRLKYF